MLDKFKRKIDYLRISVTDRCNLRCAYCMPAEGVELKSHRHIISYEKIVRLVRAAAPLGIEKIRITGGEPLVRKNISFLIREIKAVEGIGEVTMSTNGVLLDEMAVELKAAGLDRINISLDTLRPEKYRQMTRIGDIRRVSRGIDAAAEAGFKGTKINMVLIPGVNGDEVEEMEKFCREKGLVLQRINHYSLEGLDTLDRRYRAERPLPCSQCNRLRLTADGKLKPCLFSNVEIPLDFDRIRESLEEAVRKKPAAGISCTTRENWQIGG